MNYYYVFSYRKLRGELSLIFFKSSRFLKVPIITEPWNIQVVFLITLGAWWLFRVLCACVQSRREGLHLSWPSPTVPKCSEETHFLLLGGQCGGPRGNVSLVPISHYLGSRRPSLQKPFIYLFIFCTFKSIILLAWLST